MKLPPGSSTSALTGPARVTRAIAAKMSVKRVRTNRESGTGCRMRSRSAVNSIIGRRLQSRVERMPRRFAR